MNELPQRWLTADAICTLLRINRETLRDWVKKKYLVQMGTLHGARYLDPGPEYTEKLKLGYSIFTKHVHITHDIEMVNMLTAQEISAIMNVPLKNVRNRLWVQKVDGLRAAGLYQVKAVRNLVWKYNGRKKGKKRSPFLVQEFVDFFLRYQAEQDALMPTDSQFEKDDLLKKKFELLMKMPSPQREVAVKEMMKTMDLAKRFTDMVRAQLNTEPSTGDAEPRPS